MRRDMARVPAPFRRLFVQTRVPASHDINVRLHNEE